MFLRTPWLSGYMLSWFLRYMFHALPFSLFPMFPLRALCFIISLSRTLQFPLDPILLSSLRLLRSRTCIPLRRIHSLVYIFRVLVLYYLRTNITCFSLVSLWGSSEHLESPAQLRPWWGQSIAVCWTRFLIFPSVRPDPVRSKCNTGAEPEGPSVPKNLREIRGRIKQY